MSKRTPSGPPPEPAVQKLRLHYAKRGRLRFTSHRDIQRSFERALRRAGVPMAFSAGFSPHPKVSWAGAAPTGVASEAEYVEIGVIRRLDPAELRQALDEAMPPGLDILDVVESGGGALADRLAASLWQMELPQVAEKDLRAAVAAFEAADTLEVERLTKNGLRTFDARGPVVSMQVEPVASGTCAPGAAPCAILRMVVRHVTPAVRPDDVLSGLRLAADLVPPVPPLVTRLAQGPLDEESGAVTDPLAPDRSSAASEGDAVGALP